MTEAEVTLQEVERARAARGWFGLGFAAKLESAYEAATAPHRNISLTNTLIAAVIIYNLLIVGDILLVGDALWLALFVHATLVTPIMLAVALYVRGNPPPARREALLASVPVIMTLGILAVYAWSSAAEVAHYQYFVILVALFCNAVLRTRFAQAALASAIIVITHAIVMLSTPSTPEAVAVHSIALVVITSLVTLAVNRAMELESRRAFLGRLHRDLSTEALLKQKEDYERQSLEDGLTGVANRRGVEQHFATLELQPSGQGQTFAVLMIDVDHFKAYNDHYGHMAGDRCLAMVGNLIGLQIRDRVDFVGRYGGEEFVVVLTNADLLVATSTAERIRAAIHNMAIPHNASEIGRVTVSIGAATGLVGVMGSTATAVNSADEALYVAKRAGRDRVEPPALVSSGSLDLFDLRETIELDFVDAAPGSAPTLAGQARSAAA